MAERSPALDVAVTLVSHPMRMEGERLRALYQWATATFTDLGLAPNTLDVKGASFSGRAYLDFARARRRVEAADFNALSRIACALFKEKQSSTTIRWQFEARSLETSVTPPGGATRWEPTGWWELMLCMFPDALGMSESACVDLALRLARLSVDERGCVFFMHRNRGPDHYVTGVDYGYPPEPSDRTYDEGANVSSWSYGRDLHLRGAWLRDIYPINFLGPGTAAAEVEGRRLLDWLRADPPARGSVEPFPCDREPEVVLWRPPAEQIPVLRERLYRAGLVWHRQYYLDLRDGKPPPFAPMDPAPESIRADFYEGWDPKLTR